MRDFRLANRRPLLPAAFVLCAVAGSVAQAAERPANSTRTPAAAGPKAGDEVASFYTRAVTGPLMNKSVCYVCRNGQRPVVMVLLRRVDAELKPLLQSLDRLIDAHRADGLRGFGVLISDDGAKGTSTVQTFAFNNKISLPLTIASEAVAVASGQTIRREAAVTVVLYRKRKVVTSYSFRAGELKTADVKRIETRVKQLIGDAPTAER